MFLIWYWWIYRFIKIDLFYSFNKNKRIMRQSIKFSNNLGGMINNFDAIYLLVFSMVFIPNAYK